MEDLEQFGLFDGQPDDDDNELYNRLLAEPEPEPEAKKDVDYKALFDDLKAENERIRVELERDRQQRQASQSEPRNQGVFDGNRPVQQSLSETYDQIIATKGIGAAFEAFTQAMAAQSRQNLLPVAASSAQLAIENYRRSANFLSEDHREEFDKLVNSFSPEQLATVDPRNIHKELVQIDDLAYGRAAKKGRSTRANSPPQYAAGSGAGGAGKAGKAFVGRRPNDEQRKALKYAEEYKGYLKDEDIKAVLQELGD